MTTMGRRLPCARLGRRPYRHDSGPRDQVPGTHDRNDGAHHQDPGTHDPGRRGSVSRWTGALGTGLILLLSMTFAALNGGQRVTIRLGVTTFYQVPLTTVVLGALILGMVAMLVAGITSDLRVRRILRNRLAEEQDEEQARLFVDRNQITMFPEEDPD